MSTWEIEINEVSNGCWEGVAKRNSGNVVSYQGPDPNEILERLQNGFWEIELKLSEHIGNLLFNYFIERCAYEKQEVTSSITPEHFGSWIISKGKRRVVFDGKDQWYILQLKTVLDIYKDDTVIKSDNISSDKISFMYSWLVEG